MQVQAADLSGEVSSVSDNTITLKVIKMPALSRNGTVEFTGETKIIFP